jgi:hypothetical protein
VVVVAFIVLTQQLTAAQELLLFVILALNVAQAELSLLLADLHTTHLPHQGHLQHEPFC